MAQNVESRDRIYRVVITRTVVEVHHVAAAGELAAKRFATEGGSVAAESTLRGWCVESCETA